MMPGSKKQRFLLASYFLFAPFCEKIKSSIVVHCIPNFTKKNYYVNKQRNTTQSS